MTKTIRAKNAVIKINGRVIDLRDAVITGTEVVKEEAVDLTPTDLENDLVPESALMGAENSLPSEALLSEEQS